MALQVYRVASIGGGVQDHHGIFVETDADAGTGVLFHVTGDIQNGMTYESRDEEKPEDSVTFISKTPIGKISAPEFLRIDAICRRLPPPPKQFNGPKRINSRVPLRRCQEWVREAIQALQNEGVLKETTTT